MEAGVSVIICTYNGAKLLPETLRHLAMQQVPAEIPWEVILIDNASTDGTAETAAAAWRKYGSQTPFSVFPEPKAGLSFAREAGLARARYEFVLFCDDDNWLCPDYIKLACQLMLQNPGIGMLGGYGELVYETKPPHWARNSTLFANGAQATKNGKVKRNVVYGAGSIMRRSAFNALLRNGFTSRLTDRQGNSLSSGGDYELCYAMALAGYEIWYHNRLIFRHYIPSKRLSRAYFERYFHENARSFEALVPYRFLANEGCRTMAGFHYYYCKTVASYTKKLLPAFLKHCLLPSGLRAAQTNELLYISLKAKLAALRQYITMAHHFRELCQVAKTLENQKAAKQASINHLHSAIPANA